MNEVANLEEYRNKRRNPYKNKIASIPLITHAELLIQLLEFKRERVSVGALSEPLISWGIPLFTALSKSAHNFEFKNFTYTYLNHLHHELRALKGTPPSIA